MVKHWLENKGKSCLTKDVSRSLGLLLVRIIELILGQKFTAV